MMEQKKKKKKSGNYLNPKEQKKFNWNLFFLVFLHIQPLLDISYSLSTNYLGFSISINTIIRMLFLLFGGIYLLFINKDKRIKWYVIILGLYCLAFGINIFLFKKEVLFYELKNMLSTFFFPISLLFVYQAFKDKKINIKEKHFLYLMLIYLGFIIIPNLLGLGFSSYAHDKAGSAGWFYSANAISSILTLLFPISLVSLLEKKSFFKLSLFSLITIYTFLTIGTKSPILGLLIAIFLLVIYILISLIKTKKYKLLTITLSSSIIFIVCLLIVIPKTTFYKNIELHMSYFDINKISDVFTSRELINQVVFSKRLDFWENTKNNYDNSNLKNKILGIGYVENYKEENENLKTVEIDYIDIFYRHGPFGFIIYFLPLLFTMINLFKRIKRLDIYKYLYLISIGLSLILAFFTGHIFTAPAVSIILIYILVNLYERSNSNEESKS